ncbi:MAG: hypothetical protein M1813_008698 [Trichoglossum hirsutum]|jgi:hypothetical protein|nr:MAG: hypothetical protein M1813_008698 [Trichoglossum hirsutum]
MEVDKGSTNLKCSDPVNGDSKGIAQPMAPACVELDPGRGDWMDIDKPKWLIEGIEYWAAEWDRTFGEEVMRRESPRKGKKRNKGGGKEKAQEKGKNMQEKVEMRKETGNQRSATTDPIESVTVRDRDIQSKSKQPTHIRSDEKLNASKTSPLWISRADRHYNRDLNVSTRTRKIPVSYIVVNIWRSQSSSCNTRSNTARMYRQIKLSNYA